MARRSRKQSISCERNREDTHNREMGFAPTASFWGAVPNFSGEHDEDVVLFLEKVNRAGRLSRWTESEKLEVLKMKLTGKAHRWLVESVALDQEYNYAQFEKKVKEFFQKKITTTKKQLDFNTLRQSEGENVRSLANRVENVVRGLFEGIDTKGEEKMQMLNRLMVTRFVEAIISPEIQIEIRKSKTESFTKAVDIAQNMEDCMRSYNEWASDRSPEHAMNSIRQTDKNDEIVKRIDEAFNQLSVRLERLEGDNKNRGEVKYRDYSAEKERKQNLENRYCHICNVRTHNTSICWYNSRTHGVKPWRPTQKTRYTNNGNPGN